MNIAIDFDGTIHKYSKGWQNGVCYDEPIEGAIEALKKLQDKGYTLIIFTCREGESLEMAKDWLSKYGINDIEVTNKKPKAICYVDDKGIRFQSWRDTLNYF